MRNNRTKSKARRRRSNRKHRLNRRQRRNLKRLENSSLIRPSVNQEEANFQSIQLTASQEKLFLEYPLFKISNDCACKIKRPACLNGVNCRYNTRTLEEYYAWRTAKDEEKQLIFQKFRELYAAEKKLSLEIVSNYEFFRDIPAGPIKPKIGPIVNRILNELPWEYHSCCTGDDFDLTADMKEELEDYCT